MNSNLCPPAIIASLRKFAEYGILPGDFLQAVLSNNLREAFAQADNYNAIVLGDIVAWVYDHLPAPCWGDRPTMLAWSTQQRATWEGQRPILDEELASLLPPEARFGDTPDIAVVATQLEEDARSLALYWKEHAETIREDSRQTLTWLSENKAKLAALATPFSADNTTIAFLAPTRDQTMAIILAFPGTWRKYDANGRLRYERVSEEPVQLVISNAELPPGCRVVQKEETVPASKRIIETIVCGKADPEPATPEGEAEAVRDGCDHYGSLS